MTATIVNPQPKYQPARMLEPATAGYLLIGALVEPTLGRTPFPRRSQRRAALLSELKSLATGLEQHQAVTKATVYRAALIPPPNADAQRLAAHQARYDIAILIETTDVGTIAEVEDDPRFRKLLGAVTAAASEHHLMRARNLRRIGDVDKTRPGLFLFNFFAAKDPAVALDLWDHLAGWYAAETGLDNSTLLGPLGPDDYVFVNHARWDLPLPVFAARMFSKRSFYSYVVANLHVNDTAAMPILYRLA
jgi:hypothetical protein